MDVLGRRGVSSRINQENYRNKNVNNNKKKQKRNQTNQYEDDTSMEDGQPQSQPQTDDERIEDDESGDEECDESDMEGEEDRRKGVQKTPERTTEEVSQELEVPNNTTNPVTPTAETPGQEVRIAEPSFPNATTELTEEHQQQAYLLMDPQVRPKLEEEMKKYVTKYVFSLSKFNMGEENEMKHCRVAVYRNEIKSYPEGVNRMIFGKKFHKIVRLRQKELRANSASSAKWKFESKLCEHVYCWVNLYVLMNVLQIRGLG